MTEEDILRISCKQQSGSNSLFQIFTKFSQIFTFSILRSFVGTNLDGFFYLKNVRAYYLFYLFFLNQTVWILNIIKSGITINIGTNDVLIKQENLYITLFI